MEPPSFLPIAAPYHPAELLAQLMKGLVHTFAVLPCGHFRVSTGQFVGQLEAFLGGHLPGSQEVSFVGYQEQRDVGVRVNLPDVLVQGADDAVAFVVRDGVDKHKAIRPVDGTVDLLLATDAVGLFLLATPRRREEKIPIKLTWK